MDICRSLRIMVRCWWLVAPGEVCIGAGICLLKSLLIVTDSLVHASTRGARAPSFRPKLLGMVSRFAPITRWFAGAASGCVIAGERGAPELAMRKSPSTRGGSNPACVLSGRNHLGNLRCLCRQLDSGDSERHGSKNPCPLSVTMLAFFVWAADRLNDFTVVSDPRRTSESAVQ
jgi:hypothetical protein